VILIWWVISSLLGLLALPIAFRVFHRLPDRGYALARPLGLMITSYLVWLGASLEFIPNNLGGALGALLILTGISLALGKRDEIRKWLRRERRLVLGMEAVFAIAFLLWAFVRANNPEIQHTEKPMELAFINGILRSDTFPPLDPWLSGYGISYYYFGYVMIGQLTLLSGASSAVAFNLANAMWFGLVAVTSYSVLYNLLAARGGRVHLAVPLLAPLFVLITGNLEGILDVVHSRQLLPEGDLATSFWSWLDIKDLSLPPSGEPSWVPQRHLWWWRASRVVRDVNLAGADIEVIDEFPFFSFLLADNHPHLLAIPFAMLAVSFSLQIFLADESGQHFFRTVTISALKLRRWGRRLVAGVIGVVLIRGVLGMIPDSEGAALSLLETVQRATVELLLLGAGVGLLTLLVAVLVGVLPSLLRKQEFAFAAWLFGGLAFLNTWDSPIYLVLLVGALAWVNRDTAPFELLKRSAFTALAVGAAAILLYLPWYPSFASQAGGLLVNVLFPTRLQHFVVMFGVSFIPIAVWLLVRLRRDQPRGDLLWKVGIGLPVALLMAALVLGFANYLGLSRDPAGLESALRGLGVAGETLSEGIQAVLSAAVERRLMLSSTALVLGLTVGAGAALLVPRLADKQESKDRARPFVLLLVGIAALLVLAPEFVYLRDLFGTRMNTVFKFYFAAWLLWGLAAAYACIELWPRRWSALELTKVAVFIPLAFGLVYPALATRTKANGFSPSLGRTLDGAAYLEVVRGADRAAIEWINRSLPTGVIAEAIGGSYSDYGRISAHTGLPTVLGWGGHEVQWRGNAAPQGSRQSDIQRLYETNSWPEAAALMDQYDIEYVYVGPLETATYLRLDESKFDRFLNVVYENGEVRIYARGASG
jgi:uncharacterized membrane protein